ncbi:MAG: RidA family protein [Solirubrobacterales bacterium]
MAKGGIEAFWPGGISAPRMPYSPAIKAGPWVFIAGQLASDWGPGGLAPECRTHPDVPYQNIAQRVQTEYVLQNIKDTCEAAGASLDDHSMRIYNWFVAPDQDRDGGTWLGDGFTITPYLEERDNFLTHARPASTGMGIKNLLVKDTVIEIDLILKTDTEKEQVQLDVPTALAGYSQGLKSGDFVFTAGEHATDFKGDWGRSEYWGPRSAIQDDARTPSQLFWYGLPLKLQTQKLLEKLESNLESCGSSKDDVVHATFYYSHPKNLAEMEEAWREFYPENPPARTLIPYMGIGVRDCDPEIALIALKKDGETKKESIVADGVAEPIGHEPHAVKAGDLVFFSTLIAGDKDGLCENGRRSPNYPWYGEPARAQMHDVLEKASGIMEAAGSSLENICRRQAFHTDFTWFAESIAEWERHFPDVKPASTTIEIGGPLHVEGALFLLDLIGYAPE